MPVKIIKDQCNDTKFYGNSYGGWCVCREPLNSDSVIYSFGIGEDMSFEMDLIEDLDCEIFAFDPTPKSIDWLNKQTLSRNLTLYDFGVGGEDGYVDFYQPVNTDYVSCSTIEADHLKSEPIEVKMKTLETIMGLLGDDKIDLLKMDVEGSEYEVISEIVKKKIKINQILVEFHHRFSSFDFSDTEEAIEKLNNMGYKLFNISESKKEYSFIYAS